MGLAPTVSMVQASSLLSLQELAWTIWILYELARNNIVTTITNSGRLGVLQDTNKGPILINLDGRSEMNMGAICYQSPYETYLPC